MVFTKAPHGAVCSFESCGHALAITELTHEFVNRPTKFLCEKHDRLVRKAASGRKS